MTPKRRYLRTGTGGNVHIRGGQVIDKHLAKIVCRCAECLGPVDYHNAGLACVADKSHKGLIHRTEAAAEAWRRDRELAEVGASYKIENGAIVALDDHTKER